MNVILDTNVVLDVLTNRKPFVDASARAIAIAEQSGCAIAITANTITDLFFLLRKHLSDSQKAKAILLGTVQRITVLDTTKELCLLAFSSPVSDFEDAVLVQSAIQWNANYIMTRNPRDFAASSIEAITPEEFILRLAD